MFDFITVPLGWILRWCFVLVKDYGVALILFTLLTKLLLYPLSVKQQINTASMASFSPKLEQLKKKYGNNKEKYNEEMMKLYSAEGVNPMSSCLPLLIQMPILFGLIDVVYKPLKHILGISSDVVNKAVDIINNNKDAFKGIADNSNFHSRPELFVMDAVHKSPDMFSSLGSGFVDKVTNFNYSFLGLPVGDVPTFASILVLIPIISFIANLGLTIYTQYKSKKTNPSAQQMGAGMNAMLYIMPIFSAVFAFQVPAGVGLYWIFSSVFSLLQSILLYRIYTPERVALIVAKKKKKKASKPSFYQRALDAQQAQKNGTKPVSVSSKAVDEDFANVDKLSKSEAKEAQRQKLNDARRRMAEKYGETYDDNLD